MLLGYRMKNLKKNMNKLKYEELKTSLLSEVGTLKKHIEKVYSKENVQENYMKILGIKKIENFENYLDIEIINEFSIYNIKKIQTIPFLKKKMNYGF